MADFGSLPYADCPECKEEDMYLEDSTTPSLKDKEELSWVKTRLRELLTKHYEVSNYEKEAKI